MIASKWTIWFDAIIARYFSLCKIIKKGMGKCHSMH